MAHKFNTLAVGSFMVMTAILMATLITEARPSILDSVSALAPYNLHAEAGLQAPSELPLAPYNFHEQPLQPVRRPVPSGPVPLPPHNCPKEGCLGVQKQEALGTCPAFNIGIENHADGLAWQVQITNLCKCSATNVILNCPNFSSGTQTIDPQVFTINGDGTCTVKKGKAMSPGEMISFKYYQVMQQNLSVRSVNFGC